MTSNYRVVKPVGCQTIDWNLLQYRWSLTKRALKGSVATAMAFGLGLSLLQLGLPLFSMQIFDRVLPTGQLSTLAALAIITIFVTLISTVIDASRSLILNRSGQTISTELDEAVVRASLDGRRSSQLQSDLDSIIRFFNSSTSVTLLDAPWSMFYVIALSLVNVWLGVYTSLAFIVVAGLSLGGDYYLSNGRSESQRLDNLLTETLRLDVHTRQELVAMGIMPGLMHRVLGIRLLMTDNSNRHFNRLSWIDALSRTVRALLQIGVMVLAAFLTVRHDINAGSIVASSMLFTRSVAPVERLTGSISYLKRARRSWKNIDELVAQDLCVDKQMLLPDVRGQVSIRNASFRAVGRQDPILDDISLELEPGLLYVIVGNEGAGKTTLAKLLCGGLVASTGSVCLDNMNFSNYDQSALAAQVGFLPEVHSGRRGSISSVISREGEIRHDQVISAATSAGIDGLIRSLPLGYQTEIVPGSTMLSAGQLKRLAIARAIYGDPALLVLDEPMIGLDGTGEDCVLSILQFFKDLGKTVVVVARSPRLLQMADKLLLLEKGKVVLTVGETSLKSFVGPREVVR